MSTRGAIGFIKNKEYKVSYNHFDSYPEGKGQNVVNFIKNTSVDKMNQIFDNIILVNQRDIPNKKQEEEIQRFLINHKLENPYKVENFGNGKIDWYYYLNQTQGILEFYNDGLRYMTDDKDFMDDTLFCEYAYLIDLDNNKLRIKANDREVSYDFNNIPNNWIENTYERLENKCKNKFMELVYDKDDKEQKEMLTSLNLIDFVKSPLKKYDYYANENVFKDILNNIEEKELESILDKYIDKELEVA